MRTKVNNYLIDLKKYCDLNKDANNMYEMLGRFVLYNPKKNFLISFKNKEKIKKSYFKMLLYKADLSMDKRNKSLNIYVDNNVLNSINTFNYIPLINNKDVYFYNNEEIEDLSLHLRENYIGQILTDEENNIYLNLENNKVYLFGNLKKVDRYCQLLLKYEKSDYHDPFILSKKENLKAYNDKWKNIYFMVIEDVLNHYENGIYFLDWQEEIKETNKVFEKLFSLDLDEMYNKYSFLKNKKYKIKRTKKDKKYSDLELILRQEIRLFLENIVINKKNYYNLGSDNIFKKKFITSEELTDLVQNVIDCIYGIDNNKKTNLLVLYKTIYKKFIDNMIRRMIKYYKEKK